MAHDANLTLTVNTNWAQRLPFPAPFLSLSVLNSLNLPAAIEDVTGDSVPASVLEKSRKVQDLGGIQFIDGLMSELPELLQR